MKLARKGIKRSCSIHLIGNRLRKCRSYHIYHGVTISSSSRRNYHGSNICMKAIKTLGILRLYPLFCPQDVKKAEYNGLVRSVLEYGSSGWDYQNLVLQEELEMVHNRVATFVAGHYSYETRMALLKSWNGILASRIMRRGSKHILLYQCLKWTIRISTMNLNLQVDIVKVAIP